VQRARPGPAGQLLPHSRTPFHRQPRRSGRGQPRRAHGARTRTAMRRGCGPHRHRYSLAPFATSRAKRRITSPSARRARPEPRRRLLPHRRTRPTARYFSWHPMGRCAGPRRNHPPTQADAHPVRPRSIMVRRRPVERPDAARGAFVDSCGFWWSACLAQTDTPRCKSSARRSSMSRHRTPARSPWTALIATAKVPRWKWRRPPKRPGLRESYS
jgi:hypothetical protein